MLNRHSQSFDITLLQVCLTNQGFSALRLELYYVYLTKLSRSLIVVRATLRQSVCLWT